MKNKIVYVHFLLAFFCFTTWSATGQTVTQADQTHHVSISNPFSQPQADAPLTDTSSIVLPYNQASATANLAPTNWFKYQREIYLITASEMAAAGFSAATALNALGWQNLLAGTETMNGEFHLYLMNTTDTVYNSPSNALGTTWDMTNFTEVIMNPDFTVNINANFNNMVFNNPFPYTGGAIYVAWEFSSPDGTQGTRPNVIACRARPLNPTPMGRYNYSQTAPSTFLNQTTSQRPVTVLSTYPIYDIVSVLNIYASGKIPVPYGAPTTVGVRVANYSATTATFSLNLTVKDAMQNIVRYTTTLTGNTLAPNSIGIVNFTSWSPTLLEDDYIYITATATGETFLYNNTMKETVNVNNNVFSYAFDTYPPNGITGTPNGISNIIACKYTMHGAGYVPGINAIIGNQTAAVGNTITPVLLNSSGTIVATGNPYTTVTADKGQSITFNFATPVLFTEEIFYAGLLASSTTVISCFNEFPSRGGINYFFAPGGGTPVESTEDWRYGIEALASPYIGVVNPSTFTAASISASQIDLSWALNASSNPVMLAVNTTNAFGTPQDGIAYSPGTNLPGGGTILYVGSNSSYYNTGLAAGTTYYYKLWSFNGSRTYSPGITTNNATCFGLPYIQNFDASLLLPSGWTGDMYVAANHGKSSSKGLTFNLSGSTGQLACSGVTPSMVLPSQPCRLIFDYRLVNASGYPGAGASLGSDDKVEIQISNNNGSTWNTLFTINYLNHTLSTNFKTDTIPIGAYTGVCKFRFQGTWGWGNYFLDIDNLVVTEIISCAMPGALTASGITISSAVIGWNNAQFAEIDYGPAGHAAGTGTIISPVVNNPYTLTGLNPAYAYDVYIRRECSSAAFSNWAGPLSFSTLDYVSVTPTPFSFGSVNLYGTSASQVFTIANNSASPETIDSVKIQGSHANQFILTDGSIYPKQLNPGSSYTVSVAFSPTSMGTKNASLNVFIPEIAPKQSLLSGTGTCIMPSDLTATNITTNAATLGWNPNGTTVWDMEWGLSGFTQGTGNMVTNVSNPYNLSGLAYGSTYNFYVRSHCSGANYSTWAGPYTFVTLCGVQSAPFAEGFENVIFPPSCWNRSSGYPGWIRSMAASGYGNGTASALANFYNIGVNAPFTLTTLSLNASSITNPVLRFDYAYATRQAQIDTLKIYSSSDNGTTYSLLLQMTGGLSGPLNTGGALTEEFVPSAGQWGTQTVSILPGTNKIKFTASSAHGNNLYLDNVRVEVSTPSGYNATGNYSDGQPHCFNATNTLTVSNFTASGPGTNIEFIAGQKVHFQAPVMVNGQSHMWAHITTTNTYCTPSDAPMVATVLQSETLAVTENSWFTIFPNPTSGNFTLVQHNNSGYNRTTAEIYNLNGDRLLSIAITLTKQEIPVAGLAPGLYFVKIISDQAVESFKLIKTR